MVAGVISKHFQNSLSWQHFDPNNKEHLEAYRMVEQEGRQHPSLRFFLNDRFFSDVPTMMAKCIAKSVTSKILEEERAAKEPEKGSRILRLVKTPKTVSA
jgi:hypothetical protein